MSPYRSLAACPLLFAAAVQAAPESVPLYRDVKDWVVACDNGRRCQALSAREDAYTPLRLQLSRDAGPQAELSLRLVYAGETQYFPLLLDDRLLPDPLTNALSLEERDGELMLSAQGADALALLAELRNGDRLRMAVDADEEAVVSLAGLSAALLLMDSVQDRLETRGALYRPGSRADAEVPPAPPLPRLRPYPGGAALAADEAERIIAAVMQRTRAEWQEPDMAEQPVGEAHGLNADEALVLIRSWCAAYNCEYALYRVARQAPYGQRELGLEPLPEGSSAPSGWVGFDEGSGVLSYHLKGRGLGDCGESAEWRFDGEGFRLQSYRRMWRCAGSPEWPQLWRVAGD